MALYHHHRKALNPERLAGDLEALFPKIYFDHETFYCG